MQAPSDLPPAHFHTTDIAAIGATVLAFLNSGTLAQLAALAALCWYVINIYDRLVRCRNKTKKKPKSR